MGARDFATLGAFDGNALLISGQKVNYHISGCNVNGLPRLEFSEPVKPDIHYHYLPGKKDNFGDQPIIIDEIAEEYIEVRKITDYEVPTYLSLSSINSRSFQTHLIFRHLFCF